MKFEIKTTIEEAYLPTPRHRRHHYRLVPASFMVEIPEVDAATAPVAIIQRGWGPPDFRARFSSGNRVEYRWYDGRLWARPRLGKFLSRPPRNRFATVADIQRLRRPYNLGRMDEEQTRGALNQRFGCFLLVDGKLHEEIGEPRYVVMTFGLGHNHGGTALTDDNSFNSNISRDRYFRIDQYKAARDLAAKIAKARGDTNDLPIKPHSSFEILIPESVQLDSSQHGEGDPFLNKLYALSESGIPPMGVAAMGMSLALQPDR